MHSVRSRPDGALYNMTWLMIMCRCHATDRYRRNDWQSLGSVRSNLCVLRGGRVAAGPAKGPAFMPPPPPHNVKRDRSWVSAPSPRMSAIPSVGEVPELRAISGSCVCFATHHDICTLTHRGGKNARTMTKCCTNSSPSTGMT